MKQKKTAIYLAVMLALYWQSGAKAIAADAGTCYTINDPDYRAMCRAKAHKDPGICYVIKRNDIRSTCLAETRK